MLPTILPIILAIRDEDDRNFVAEVYTKYTKHLQAIAKHHLKNNLDVEDCVQDVVIVLIDRVEEFRYWDEIRQLGFLTKTCRFIAINKYNYNKRKVENEISYNLPDGNDLDIIDEDEFVEKIIVSKETQKRFAQMLEEIDSKYGDILYFRCFLRMKNVEIAKILNISESLVSMRFIRAKNFILTEKEKDFYAIFGK